MLNLKKLLFVILCTFSIPAFAKTIEISTEPSNVEVFFILDRSGSMSGLEDDTIGGFNGMLQKQKQENLGKTFITTVLFDHQYELLHDHILLSEIKPMTSKEYFVRGNTALLDAMGKSISKAKTRQDTSKKVLFVVITDGQENSSKEYSLATIKKLVKDQQAKGWEFLFLGANMDAIGAANSLGISTDKAVTYISDKEGTQKNYEAVSEAIKSVRKGKNVDKEWKKSIEDDVKNRKH